MKQHKTQILAALALTLVLGAMTPVAAFAVDNNTATQADTKAMTVTESLVELYNRIATRSTFAKYRAALPLIDAVNNMEKYTTSNTTSAAASAAKAELITQVQKAVLTATGVDTMSTADLIKTAKSLEKYNEYATLSRLTAFARNGVGADGKLTAAIITKTYPTEAQQITAYNAIYKAAAAIDATVTSGLQTYTNGGTTENKPAIPDTGIVDLIETGALDLGTITLIISVIVASAAGLGLIAKLYLRHKF